MPSRRDSRPPRIGSLIAVRTLPAVPLTSTTGSATWAGGSEARFKTGVPKEKRFGSTWPQNYEMRFRRLAKYSAGALINRSVDQVLYRIG